MSLLRIDTASGVATLTLDRPQQRNAFNDALIAELTAAVHDLGARDEVRCLVLAASGVAFCAGADLQWMQRMAHSTPEDNLADARHMAHLLHTLYSCPKPTVARVHGDAYAGGLGLVAACDIALAADSARFCLSEVRIGLVAATISPYVVRAIGPRAAHRYFLSAERFSAAEAHRLGLVHEVVAADALQARLDALTAALRLGSPQAQAASKRLLQEVAGQPVDAACIDHTAQCIAQVRASASAREGMDAFLNNRPPAWQPPKEL